MRPRGAQGEHAVASTYLNKAKLHDENCHTKVTHHTSSLIRVLRFLFPFFFHLPVLYCLLNGAHDEEQRKHIASKSAVRFSLI